MLHNLGMLSQRFVVLPWRSLLVGVTTIAESAMSLRLLTLLTLELHTAIGGVRDLCIVQCCCLLDLLLDNSKCVHLFTPKRMGEIEPSLLSQDPFFPFLQSFASHLQ
jgi:hypothetical protein